MVSHRSLSDSKSPQVSRTLLSILADFNNTKIRIVFTCPLISKASSLFINPLGIIPNASTTISTTVAFMFHKSFSSLARFMYICFFSLSFIFLCGLPRRQSPLFGSSHTHTHTHSHTHTRNRLIGLVGRVFASSPGNPCSIPGRVISKTFKMVLDTFLLNTQQFKVRIKGKVEQSKERSSALPYTSV